MPFVNFSSPLQSTTLSFSENKTSLRNGLDSLIVVDDLNSFRRSTFASLETGRDCNDIGYTSSFTSHIIVSSKVIITLLKAWIRWLIAWFFLPGVNDDDFTHEFSLLGVIEYSDSPKNSSAIYMADTPIQQLQDAESLESQVLHTERDFQNWTKWDWKINFGMFPIFGPAKLKFLQVELELKKALRRTIFSCIDADQNLANTEDGERKRKPRVATICFVTASRSSSVSKKQKKSKTKELIAQSPRHKYGATAGKSLVGVDSQHPWYASSP